MDQSWKNLAERMEEQVLDKYKVEKTKKKRLLKVEAHFRNGEGCAKARNTEQESEEKVVGQEFSLCLENTPCSVSKASRKS